jgi:hypothetical protein
MLVTTASPLFAPGLPACDVEGRGPVIPLPVSPSDSNGVDRWESPRDDMQQIDPQDIVENTEKDEENKNVCKEFDKLTIPGLRSSFPRPFYWI